MKVVLVRLSALGDVIHTWPLAAALRDARPDVDLTWVVEAPFRPLVDGHPAVGRVVTAATRRWRRRPLAPSTLRDLARLRRELGGADLCLDPQGVVKSAFVAIACGAPRRVGWTRAHRRERLAGLAYTETVAIPTGVHHVAARNLELVRALGTAPPRPAPAPDGRWLLRHDAVPPPAGHAFSVLLPGAGRPGKILPVAVLAEVARGIAAAGLEPVVAWGPGERDRAEEVASAAGSPARLAPPTGILELAHLLAGARLVVGGDTGPVHLAASLGVPTVGVFIASDPVRNGPLGPRAVAVSNVDETAGPGARARVRRPRPVSAAEVLAAARRLLRGAPPPGC